MGDIQIDLTHLLEWTNPVYHDLYWDKHRYLMLLGGAGSGKSWFVAQKIVMRILSETPHRFLVLRKVARTIRNSAFQQIIEIINQWNISNLFTINQNELRIKCINGNEIICCGLDDPEKIKSLIVTSIWIEEASEITSDDFKQIRIRLRGISEHYKQIILSFNPTHAYSWLKVEFFDEQQYDDFRFLKTTYKDNLYCDEQYIKTLESLKNQDRYYYEVYALGEWGVLGDTIFHNYIIEDFSTDPFNEYYNGLDFGFSFACAWLRVAWYHGELYVCDEVYGKGITNDEFIGILGPLMPASEGATADCSEPDKIEEFGRAGYSVSPCTKGAGSVKAGIDFLRRVKIHIHKERCPNTAREIGGYKYKEDKDGNVLEEPVKFNDHCMDALRYAIEPLRNSTLLSDEGCVIILPDEEGDFSLDGEPTYGDW